MHFIKDRLRIISSWMDYFLTISLLINNCRAVISVILELQIVLVKPFIVQKSSSICFMSFGERLHGPVVVVQFLFRLFVCVCSDITELCKRAPGIRYSNL